MPAGGWASAQLAAIAVLFFGGLEAFSRWGFPSLSRIERRVVVEHAALQQSRPVSSERKQIAVLGNSLLAQGVQFDELRRGLGNGYDVRRFVVEDTRYHDWYYGLRRVFAEGARPDVVIVALSPQQLVASGIRGDYFAYHLMRGGDLRSAAADAGLSNTAASGLAFANLSAFFGLRSEIRKVALSRALPGLPRLTDKIVRKPANVSPAATVACEEAALRLAALREQTQRYSADFVFVLPPTGPAKENGSESVLLAGDRSHVKVLLPIEPGALDEGFFSDGFHLNERGAKIFTQALLRSLRSELSQRPLNRVIASSRPRAQEQ